MTHALRRFIETGNRAFVALAWAVPRQQAQAPVPVPAPQVQVLQRARARARARLTLPVGPVAA